MRCVDKDYSADDVDEQYLKQISPHSRKSNENHILIQQFNSTDSNNLSEN